MPLDVSQIRRCTTIAAVKVAETHEALMAALRTEEDRRRQRPAAAAAAEHA